MPTTTLAPILEELRALKLRVAVTPEGTPTLASSTLLTTRTDEERARMADLLPLLRLNRSRGARTKRRCNHGRARWTTIM